MKSNEPPQIHAITAAETIAIRHAVLRKGLPQESAVFPNDDAATTEHFGAFVDRKLVGVMSIYAAAFPARPETGGAWQLRGMATVPELRGRGIGRALLVAALDAAARNGGAILWCNARAPAVEFYAKNGFTIFGGEFEIPTAGPHFVMAINLPAEPHA